MQQGNSQTKWNWEEGAWLQAACKHTAAAVQ